MVDNFSTGFLRYPSVHCGSSFVGRLRCPKITGVCHTCTLLSHLAAQKYSQSQKSRYPRDRHLLSVKWSPC